MGLIRFIQEHFFHVAPILIIGVFALAIVLERGRALFYVYPLKEPGAFFETLRNLVQTDRLGRVTRGLRAFPGKADSQCRARRVDACASAG